MLTIFTTEPEVPKKGKAGESKVVMSGYALAITTDGWVVAPTSALGDPAKTQLIDRDRRQYRIEKRVDDTAVPLSYLRLQSEQSILLKPIILPTVQARTFPFSGYLIRDYRTIEALSLTGLGYPVASDAGRQQSGVLSKRYNYYEQYGLSGQPFVSTKQEVLGITVAQGFVPFEVVRSGLDQVLRATVVQRPSLGVTYSDNSWLIAPVATQATPRTGATVTAVDGKGKEGVTAVFKVGDVLVTVNGERVDDRRSLSEILQEYRIGDVVTVGVQRGGKTETLSVTLQ